MDTPLRLEFELTDEERLRYWRRYARLQTRIVQTIWAVWFVVLAGAAVVAAAFGGVAWLLPFALAALVLVGIMTTFRPTEARSLRDMDHGIGYALRYVESIQVDEVGVESVRRALYRRQKLAWSGVDEAARSEGYWYFRDGGTQFIVPDRAFPTSESLAEFEAIVKDGVPPTAWRAPST